MAASRRRASVAAAAVAVAVMAAAAEAVVVMVAVDATINSPQLTIPEGCLHGRRPFMLIAF